MSKYIKTQKTRVRQSKDASFSESSPYWDDVRQHGRTGNNEEWDEHPQANPDVLPETDIAAPSTPQLLMGEAIEHLQGRQKEVYFLIMRENKSESEVAEILDIPRGNVSKYKKRAVKFISQYCKAAIAKGRV